MALQSLEQGNDSWYLVGLGSCFGNSVPGARTSALIDLLEKIVLRSVELMARSSNVPSAHPFGLGLTMAGIALRRTDSVRLSTLLDGLKAQHEESVQARKVIDYLERQMAKLDQPGRGKRGGNV
jgi:hypothetical protein